MLKQELVPNASDNDDMAPLHRTQAVLDQAGSSDTPHVLQWCAFALAFSK